MLLLAIVIAAVNAVDSESWFKNGEPSKNCAWVSEYVPIRCDVKGEDATLAMDACEDSCAGASIDDGSMDAVDDAIMMYYKGGQYNECPEETMYWEHDASVYGGYAGCVGEYLYTPCEQDGFDPDATDAGEKPFQFNETTMECVPTGTTPTTRSFWIIWGLPSDTNTLVNMTGLNPVVKFPLLRMTYPSYTWQGEEIADDSNAIPKMKSWLTYLNVMTEEQVEDYNVVMTKGTEAGMVTLIAAKILELASTTCNRNFCQFMQAPAYGYASSDSERLANANKDLFFTEGCPDEFDPQDVTISDMGWFPGNVLPSCAGFDNVSYSADSTSANSPWIETMVWPENPSGVLKTPQIPDSNRRICDGCYVYPQFFGMNGNEVAEIPECASWATSVTKAYSAAARTGFLVYKTEPATNGFYIDEIASDLTTLTYGDYSEWSWWGHVQIVDMLTTKPYTDPTSWIGAYAIIQNRKWEAIIDGFEGCPYVEVTNPNAGAYVWFRMLEPYLGLTEGYAEPTFFLETMGVRATTYFFGFRGADPATYYGDNYTNYDFVRLQLFRDVYVYEEVARRAAIVCSGGTVEGFVSGEQWAEMMGAGRRRRLVAGGGRLTVDDHKDLIANHAPHLSAEQAEVHAAQAAYSQKAHDDVQAHCAPEYATSCLYRWTGGKQGYDTDLPL
ncbi:hypothetical protein CTAYLR_004045 [Chrysophaeum taylorii]|uniref:Uncharacterized protein n=1 Tax=Chrysophaeum taylorii TaxID=2483200 RepID=A0AAD7UN74_9STRA|nr:hypothetical protein CTAYLR_004045 [Chrysophaeum taylorii]